MSGTEQTRQSRTDLILIGIAVFAFLGILIYFSTQSQQVRRKSPTGFDGLHAWIAAEGEPVRSFTGGWTGDPDVVGLRVLPIYDTKLDERRISPKTTEELLFQSDEYDLRSRTIQRKTQIVPTLIVLPKWRSGLRLTGLGHPELLLEKDAATRVLNDVFSTKPGSVRVIAQPISKYEVDTWAGQKTAQLYLAQVFDGFGCQPLIGKEGEMVLGRCPLRDATYDGFVYVLSDPDLLNNHGLRMGDNAAIALDMILPFAEGGTFMIDYSDDIWLIRENSGITRERTWADLLQFFAYPFSVLWISGALLLALVLWRSGVRFGPILRRKNQADASKEVANTAAARLMRLTEQDGAMIDDYANIRLSAIAARNLGPTFKHDPDAALRFVRTKRPELADELQDAINHIRTQPKNLNATAAIANVDRLEKILEQLTHDT